MDKQVVYEFQRNKDERVCISMGNYKDKMYVDMRVFFSDQTTGELKPTKKGLTLAYTLLPQLKNGLIACEKTRAKKADNETHF